MRKIRKNISKCLLLKILPKVLSVKVLHMQKVQISVGLIMGDCDIFKEDSSVKIVLLPSEKGSTLKGKNLCPWEQRESKFFTFGVDPVSENLRCRKVNSKSQKLFSFVEIAENLPHVSSPHNVYCSIDSAYRIPSNYCTYPYKCTVKSYEVFRLQPYIYFFI